MMGREDTGVNELSGCVSLPALPQDWFIELRTGSLHQTCHHNSHHSFLSLFFKSLSFTRHFWKKCQTRLYYLLPLPPLYSSLIHLYLLWQCSPLGFKLFNHLLFFFVFHCCYKQPLYLCSLQPLSLIWFSPNYHFHPPTPGHSICFTVNSPDEWVLYKQRSLHSSVALCGHYCGHLLSARKKLRRQGEIFKPCWPAVNRCEESRSHYYAACCLWPCRVQAQLWPETEIRIREPLWSLMHHWVT